MNIAEAAKYLATTEALMEKLVATKRIRTNVNGSISREECDAFRHSASRMGEMRRLRQEVAQEALAAVEAKALKRNRTAAAVQLLKRACKERNYSMIDQLVGELSEAFTDQNDNGGEQ